MWKEHAPYLSSVIFLAAALAGVTLMGIFIYGAVSGALGGAGPFQAPFFYRAAADALFFEGGIALTFGALVEFFLRGRSYPLARRLMLPYTMAQGETPDMAKKTYSGGWMLIYSGAILLAASLAFAVMSMK